MGSTDTTRPGRGRPLAGAGTSPTGLLDLLSVAAVVLDTNGRVVFWSPQAEDLFGYTAEGGAGPVRGATAGQRGAPGRGRRAVRRGHGVGDRLGRRLPGPPQERQHPAGRVPQHAPARTTSVTPTPWDSPWTRRPWPGSSGASPSPHAWSPSPRSDWPSSIRTCATWTVNPALERIHGRSAADHLGRRVQDVLPFLDTEAIEGRLRRVLETGQPVTDRYVVGRPTFDPHRSTPGPCRSTGWRTPPAGCSAWPPPSSTSRSATRR